MSKTSGSHAVNEFTKAPPTEEGLTETVQKINAGADEFGLLSHPGRVALVQKVTEQWEQDFVAGFHISDDLSKAGKEYAAIEQGDKYPSLSDSVREAVLRRFDDRHGDGGPRSWQQLNGS
ncbi:hypothetical protein QN360_01945 [Glaciimonas sp. CA11.2]|uniref:hypothetical protein n=1 Tax=unclassified Glaciimonas TaxID=2644401 RepID=UPI002AB35D54|nr:MULTISPECIES: hypothetical protein [unclassified Glaciimonas]MDY7546089.1 hypothetical protein [Glaciimonas sp. CA11.2]MEB0010959.1 hypothetical protein [Glaciimonas sp. Cout2]MEB0081742.1 hypothetical protein [Glaciimonas sp. Gout2]MEB0161668.1 hypothetical protein [Glaciimonas sp. CA11.2]